MKEHVIAAFEAYVSDYDLQDDKIRLKYIHTGKVADNCERIARSLGLSEPDIFLAWEIGMLHDIGRFEQLRRYDTFIDAQSIDHAQFGADLLFAKEKTSGDAWSQKDSRTDAQIAHRPLIERFERDASKYTVIEKAIRCHSLYRLPEDLSRRERTFCEIIRDADKVDIFRANYETGMAAIYNVTEEELARSAVTPEVYEAFREGHAVLRSLKRTPIDHLIGHISLMFELVYPESRRLAAKQGYLEKLIRFPSENPDTRRVLEEAYRKYREFARDAFSEALRRELDFYDAAAGDSEKPEREHESETVRQPRMEALDALLWDTLLAFQEYPFRTARQLSFSYTIKGNEMFVSRKDKSITRASIILTFHNALALGRRAPGPKALGTFGASYLYPVFQKVGVLI